MKKNKKIEVNKVEIDKVNLWMLIIGTILSLTMGIIILILTDSQDRIQIIGWVLIGYAGFKMLGEISYNKKERKKPKKKVNEKEVSKFAKNFTFTIVLTHLISIALFFLLLYSELSNLAIILIYFPLVVGLTTLGLFIFFFIILQKNSYSINKIINKFKKKNEKI